MSKNYYQIKQVKQGWTKQPNAVLHDGNLTSDAKVVIYALLSVSGEFHISEAGIASSVHLSLERVKKAVRLLKATGYIQIAKVKDGSRFGGYEWRISDVSGTFRETENRAFGNQTLENPEKLGANSERRKTKRSETERVETIPIYERPKGEYTNNEEQKEEEGIYEGTKGESIALTPTPINQSGEGIFSSGEVNIHQAFNRFCEVYPRLGDRAQAEAAFFAIPDINNICWQITNSVEWFVKIKRWDDWNTGQKNTYCPQAVKFLKRGDWQEFMKSDATMPIKDRLDAILPDEEDDYEIN